MSDNCQDLRQIEREIDYLMKRGEHRQGRDCWCLPRVESYECADVVIHNAKEGAN